MPKKPWNLLKIMVLYPLNDFTLLRRKRNQALENMAVFFKFQMNYVKNNIDS